jgi:hypothetical protein
MQMIFIKKLFLFVFGSVCGVKRFTIVSRNVANVLLILKKLKGSYGSD